jgi:hypothetical protein
MDIDAYVKMPTDETWGEQQNSRTAEQEGSGFQKGEKE